MRSIQLTTLCLLIFAAASCSGAATNTLTGDMSGSGFNLVAEDASGNQLPHSAATLVESTGSVAIYSNDPEAVGFMLEFDGSAVSPESVSQGSYFGESDLFLAIDSLTSMVAIGGRHLGDTPDVSAVDPALVARISFSEGRAGRELSAVPTDGNATQRNFSYIDVGDGTATLMWDYYNLGDYDQNSEVGLSDISPIAIYFQAVQTDTDWAESQVADGDENGEVNTADLTPIALNFQSTVSGCKVEESNASNGPWTEIASVLTADGISDPLKRFEYNFTPLDSHYYRIRAFSAEDETQGPATDPLQISLLPPGDNPVAIADSDITSGDPPLTVNFFDDGSSDDDGTIVKWEWDFEGDGTFEFDATSTSGTASHEYLNFGSFESRMRVTDNDGRMGVDSVVITVTNPDPGNPPVASAYAMPDFGWGPLTVNVSPMYSEDTDGTIVKYEWDLDGDGSFETDATANDGYANTVISTPGDHTLRLQVTDDAANTATASVSVTVLDTAASSVDYWSIFNDTIVRRIDLTVNQTNWDTMWADPDAEVEVEADAVIFGEVLPSVGLRMKGNSSLNGPGLKKPWKIDTNEFDPAQEFNNTKMVILNNGFKDASMAREIMAYKMMRVAGVPAGFATYAEVWISVGAAPAEFWGVYTYVERIDKKFIENRFIDDTGNLYKASMPADLTWHGTDINTYPKTSEGEIPYSKETNSAENDYTDLINLIDVIDNQVYGSDAEFMAALEAVFEVDDFLRYQAVSKLHSNADVYSYMSQNYYLYSNPLTGKFQWLPWDLNEAWGQFGQQSANLNHPLYDLGSFGGGPGPGGPADAPLFEKVFAVDEYRRTYAAYVDLLLRNYFNAADMGQQAKDYRDLIDPKVSQGDKMEYTLDNFRNNWNTDISGGPGVMACFGIEGFSSDRVDYANTHLWADL